MPETGLFGYYAFNQDNIDAFVATKGAGVYALDRTTAGEFKVSYVGRSDDDLPGRLKQHLSKGYAYFKYAYFPSAQAAYERECRIYHDFNPPDNIIHPDAPNGSNCTCPVASCGSSAALKALFGL
jgi:hypothetical protein